MLLQLFTSAQYSSQQINIFGTCKANTRLLFFKNCWVDSTLLYMSMQYLVTRAHKQERGHATCVHTTRFNWEDHLWENLCYILSEVYYRSLQKHNFCYLGCKHVFGCCHHLCKHDNCPRLFLLPISFQPQICIWYSHPGGSITIINFIHVPWIMKIVARLPPWHKFQTQTWGIKI